MIESPVKEQVSSREKTLFDLDQFFIKERVGFMKMRNVYDILDLSSGSQVGIAQEDTAAWVLALSFFINRRLLPATLVISKEKDGEPLVRLHRKLSLVGLVDIKDAQGQKIGMFKSKMFSFKCNFRIFDVNNNQIGEVKGDWKGWNFKIVNAEGMEIGTITKKWAGLGKELFTSADNYVVSLKENSTPAQKLLLLAAGIAIDTVYKEKK